MPTFLRQLRSTIASATGTDRRGTRKHPLQSRRVIVWLSALAGCVLLVAFFLAFPSHRGPSTVAGGHAEQSLDFLDFDVTAGKPQASPTKSQKAAQDAAAEQPPVLLIDGVTPSASGVQPAVFEHPQEQTGTTVWLTGGIELLDDEPQGPQQPAPYPHAPR